MFETPAPQPESLAHFPAFFALRGAAVLIVGGGSAALAKVALLRRAGAALRVVAAEACGEIAALAEAGEIELRRRPFASADLDGARLCFVALDDDRAAAHAVCVARRHGVPVNAVDRPKLSDFIVPAIVERGPVTIAVSTGGLAPALARGLRERIEAAVPPAFARLALWCGAWRGRVAERVPSGARRKFWDAALDGPEAEAALAGDEARADALLGARLAGAAPAAGSVALVGAGPGHPELLTLRALRLLGRADVILYDKLVGPEILGFARREARRVDVGKRCGRHPLSQQAINRLLLDCVRRGERVVRLKGGDPSIFGRSGEELEYLRCAGVQAEVVPGVTAAAAAAASLGAPLTHRGVARSLHFIAGHGAEGDEVELDWLPLGRSDATLAIYMGARNLPRLARRLLDAGVAPETPAVAIENASLADERRCFGTLAEIASKLAAAAWRGPTLILVGRTMAFAAAAEAVVEGRAAA